MRRPSAVSLLTRRDLLALLCLFGAGLLLRYSAFRYAADDGGAGYLQSLCTWGCEWYRSIIEGGYDEVPGLRGGPDRANWAFFPLYPLLVWLTTATGVPVLLAGAVVSNGAVLLAAAAARPLFASDVRAYWLFAAGLLAGPFSFLFSTLYSEGLFILLTVLVLVALQRSHYLAAAAFGALLSATRPTGVLIVFAILVQMLVDHRRGGGGWRSFPMRVLGDPALLLPLFLAPLGLFVYMAYLHLHVGDALAFAHIQRAWGRELESPLATLGGVFGSGLSVDYFPMVLWSWAVAALAGFALSGYLVFRGRYAAAVFCFLCLLVSLTTGVGSMVRFVAGLAPLGMGLALLLGRWRTLSYAAAAAAILSGLALTLGRFNGSMLVM